MPTAPADVLVFVALSSGVAVEDTKIRKRSVQPIRFNLDGKRKSPDSILIQTTVRLSVLATPVCSGGDSANKTKPPYFDDFDTCR